MSVGHNFLTGTIPSEIAIPSTMKTLHLNDNNIGGTISVDIISHNMLVELDLGMIITKV